MAYENHLGQAFQFTPTALTSYSAPATSSSDAWRDAVKKQAVVVANTGGGMSTAEKQAGGTALADFIRYMITIAGNANAKTKPEMQVLVAFAKVPTIYDSPSRWDTAGVRALRDQLAKLKAIFAPATAPTAAPAPTFSFMPQTTAVRPTPVAVIPTAPGPTPPPANVAAPEVQCTDGYFRDATGLCVPGSATPGPIFVDTPAFTTGPAPVFTTTPTMTPGVETSIATSSPGLFGVSYKWWGLGAAGLAVGALLLRRSKNVTPNARRRRRRS